MADQGGSPGINVLDPTAPPFSRDPESAEGSAGLAANSRTVIYRTVRSFKENGTTSCDFFSSAA